VDKVKNRLEQLDDFEEGSVRQMLDLTQHEYMNRTVYDRVGDWVLYLRSWLKN
jgi:S-adenosylmethionine synthetase